MQANGAPGIERLRAPPPQYGLVYKKKKSSLIKHIVVLVWALAFVNVKLLCISSLFLDVCAAAAETMVLVASVSIALNMT